MAIQIIKDKAGLEVLQKLAQEIFGDMVKIVIDVEKRIMAAGGEMHYDCEQALLQEGSRQENLWGANIVFLEDGNIKIEYTSLINIRPRAGNRSQEIADPQLRTKMEKIITGLIS